MTVFKRIAVIALVSFLTVLVAIILVEKAEEPVFVSPETAFVMHLDRGYSMEEAQTIREQCEQKGCTIDENGTILVNRN